MEQGLTKKVFQIEGMTCANCETRIENAVKKLEGVIEVRADYCGSKVYIGYNANITDSERIIEEIEKLDYMVRNKPVSQDAQNTSLKKTAYGKAPAKLLGIGVIALALYIIFSNTAGFSFIPEIDQSMGYAILFVAGLLTSLHCIAMCGGINLSQCITNRADGGNSGKLSKIRPSLLYNCGRVISYTIIGGIAGALGSGISFSGAARGVVAVISGVFMVILGLNMLNIFPWLRKLSPRLPKVFGGKKGNNGGKYGPFIVGLLNGLMPCGPLQAMQIYALGTGSFTAGALSMLVFSVGTVPLMFGFGAVSSILGGKLSHKMMKAGAVLVIVLGVIMANRGLALSGISLPSLKFGNQGGNVAAVKDGIQTVTTRLSPGSYEPITVQKGIPVKWTIRAERADINGCNNEIVIPEFNKREALEEGDNVIEFTPTETGTFVYSCWMGMIRSKITVVDDISNAGASSAGGKTQDETAAAGKQGAAKTYKLPSCH